MLKKSVFPGSAFAHEFIDQFLVTGRGFFTGSGEVEQLFGVVFHLDTSQVQDHDRSAHALRELQSFYGVPHSQFAFAGPYGRELVKVRRGVIDAHRQGTKIMQARDLDVSRLDRIQDSGQQRNARAVA